MRHQPIPEVTLNDVERIVRRDFPVIQFDSVMAVLKEYEESTSGRRERPRVQLATLKLANGDVEALRTHINTAVQDIRDVLGPAEYPRVFEGSISSSEASDRRTGENY